MTEPSDIGPRRRPGEPAETPGQQPGSNRNSAPVSFPPPVMNAARPLPQGARDPQVAPSLHGRAATGTTSPLPNALFPPRQLLLPAATPTTASSSSSDHRATKRPLALVASAEAQADPRRVRQRVDDVPAVSLTDLPLDVLARIVAFLPYPSLDVAVRANVALRRAAEALLRAHLDVGPPAERARFTPVYGGIVHLLARLAPERSLATELRPAAPVSSALAGLVAEVVRATGWRRFSAPLRLPRTEPVSLGAFTALVERHVLMTEALRANPVYPVRPWNSDRPPQGVAPLHAHLRQHWRELHVGSGAMQDADRRAEDVMNHLMRRNDWQTGDNVTVAVERGRHVLYSNRPLPARELEGVPDLDVAPAVRRLNGPEHGRGRIGGRYPDIPFHSEAQWMDRYEPWLLEYAGNIYNACPQCLAAYHALGVRHGRQGEGSFRGSHRNKAPSVIPPRVRRNSVYLEHYVGEQVWQVLGDVLLVTRRAALLEEAARRRLAEGGPDAEAEAADLRAAATNLRQTLQVRMSDVFDLLDVAERQRT